MSNPHINTPLQGRSKPQEAQTAQPVSSPAGVIQPVPCQKEPLNLVLDSATRTRPNMSSKQHSKRSHRSISNSTRELPGGQWQTQPRDPGTMFERQPIDPSLFRLRVQKRHLEHLMKDDLDEISKYEVIYKILKDQLRAHQSTLIDLKEKKRLEASKSAKKAPKHLHLDDFAKEMKKFEFYGCQRDLSPELKRIVKNLACQEHRYLYCPCCKKYEQADGDPLDNINKFMQFIRDEQDKLTGHKKARKVEKKKRHPDMPDDSVSEITDLEKEEILAKYYENKLTDKQKKQRELSASRRRLRGEP